MFRKLGLILLSFCATSAMAAGPHFSNSGGIGSSTSTYSNGEPTSGTYSINGTTGVATFAQINHTNTTNTDAIITAPFWPGGTNAIFSDRVVITPSTATSLPFFGRSLECESSIHTGPYSGCLFVGYHLHTGGNSVPYGINAVTQIDTGAGAIPGTGMELNFNNNSVDSSIPLQEDPLFGVSGNPWTTGLNVVHGGSKLATAGISIDTAGGNTGTSGRMQRGLTVYGNIYQEDLDLGASASTAIRIAGQRTSAAIDTRAVTTTNPAKPVILLMPNGGYVSSLGASDGVIKPLIYLNGSDTVVLGQPGVPVSTGSNFTSGGTIAMSSSPPASSSSTCTTGTMTWDSGYVYVCVATNTWKRSALAAF